MDFIEVYENAIPLTLCDRLRQTLDQHKGTTQGRTGHGVDVAKKDSLDLTLDTHPELAELKNALLGHALGPITQYFDQYAMALMGAVAVNVDDNKGGSVTLTPDNYPELGRPRASALVKYLYRSGVVNIQKYKKNQGGYPHWHSEQYPQSPHNEPLHRVLLYMVYLNDVADGGETEFYYQNKIVKPKKGSLLIAPAGFTHTHRGRMPLSEDKYIATSWVMFNRAERLYAPVK